MLFTFITIALTRFYYGQICTPLALLLTMSSWKAETRSLDTCILKRQARCLDAFRPLRILFLNDLCYSLARIMNDRFRLTSEEFLSFEKRIEQ